MRKTITTFADLQLHKNSQKKFLFEVDPAKILADWTAEDDGLYSTPWAGGLYSDTDFLTLEQDGVALTRVETLAECVATAGTCFLQRRGSGWVWGTPIAFSAVSSGWGFAVFHSTAHGLPRNQLVRVDYTPDATYEGDFYVTMAPEFGTIADHFLLSQSPWVVGYPDYPPDDLITFVSGKTGAGTVAPWVLGDDFPLVTPLLYVHGAADVSPGDSLMVIRFRQFFATHSGCVFSPPGMFCQAGGASVPFTAITNDNMLRILAHSPVAYYRFDGGALLTDSSGNGHTLTALSDPTSIAGGIFGGGCASLDGIDCFQITDHADLKPTGNFSVVGWIKKSAKDDGGIFQSYSDLTDGKIAGIRVGVDNAFGQVVFLSGKNTGNGTGDFGRVYSASNVCDGFWHFIVCTWDSTSNYLSIYVDAVLESVKSWPYAPAYKATNYVMVGCYWKNTGREEEFNGILDEVFILNGTSLTLLQIKQLYTARAMFYSVGHPFVVDDYVHITYPDTDNYRGEAWIYSKDSADIYTLTKAKGELASVVPYVQGATGAGSAWLNLTGYPVIYKPLLENIPAFMARDDDIVGSGSEIAIGSLTLLNGKNADYGGGGPLDVCLKEYIYPRARCRSLIGGESLPYSEFLTYWCGLVDTIALQSAKTTFNIKDSLQALDFKYPTETYKVDERAFWKFNEPNWWELPYGTLTDFYVDSSGNNHTLTKIGGPWPRVDGNPVASFLAIDGCCAQLGGDDAFSAVMHADLCPVIPFEVNACVQFSGLSVSITTLVANTPVSGTTYGWRLCLKQVAATDVAYFEIYDSIGNLKTITGGTDLHPTDGWVKITANWDGTHINLYIGYVADAIPVACAALPAYVSGNSFRIGCRWNGSVNTDFHVGEIDEVKITTGKLITNADGVAVPTVFGMCYNTKPVQENTQTWVFKMASHPIKSFPHVREAGIDITQTNIADIDPEEAWFLLSAWDNSKVITCDVDGMQPWLDDNGRDWQMNTYGSIALYLLGLTPGLSADDINTPAFWDFDNTYYPYRLGVYLADYAAVRDTLALMNLSVAARLIKGRDGRFRPQKFGMPSAVSEFNFTTATISELNAQVLQDKLYYKVRVGYAKNWFVQADTAHNNTQVIEREDWSHTYLYVEVTNEATKQKYKCEDTLTVETLLTYKADALRVAADYLALLQQPWLSIEFRSSMTPYTLEIGDTISVDDGRFFDSTSRFVITAMVDDPATATVTITAKAPCDGTMNLI